MENGDTFEGDFKFNKPIGNGCWNLKNGNVVKGCYSQELIDVDEPGNEESVLDPELNLRVKIDWNTETLLKAQQ